MSRKTVDVEARQSFFVDAARNTFAKKGIENTTMEDIASAAEYTRRTLYSYFKSRDEIALMVQVESDRARWKEQQEAMRPAKRGLDKIMIWGRTLYEYCRRNPQAIDLQLYWDLKGINPQSISYSVFKDFEELNNELADGLRAIFRLGIEDGSLRPDLNIDLCISHFLYSIRNVIKRALSTTYSFAKFDSEEYIDHYLDLFRRGIQSKKETI